MFHHSRRCQRVFSSKASSSARSERYLTLATRLSLPSEELADLLTSEMSLRISSLCAFQEETRSVLFFLASPSSLSSFVVSHLKLEMNFP